MYGRLPQATVILRRSEWAGGRRRSRRTFARVWAKGRPPTRRSEWPHRGPPHDNVRVSSFPPPVPDCTLIFYASSPVGRHGFGFAQTTMIFKCHPINEGACCRLISCLLYTSPSPRDS